MIRLALAGAGSSGRDHLRAAAGARGIAIVALADPDLALARKVAAQFAVERVGRDVLNLLDERIDGAIVAVPTDLHAPVSLPLLSMGLPVLLEKPLARTLADADRIRRTAEESDVPLHTGMVRRFDASWAAAIEELRAGRIGSPVVWRHSQAKPGPIDKPWYNVAERGGGPFLDECLHTVDIALDTFGPVEWVFAHLRTLRQTNTAFDTGTATIRFRAGDELMLSWSWGLPRHCRAVSLMDFLGPNGCIALEERDEGEALVVRAESRHCVGEARADALAQAFVRQLEAFGDAVRRGERYDDDDGAREALRACLALLKSAERHERIDLQSFAHSKDK